MSGDPASAPAVSTEWPAPAHDLSGPLVEPLDPAAMLDAIRAAAISHVITVPDTHQKSLLALLMESSDPLLVTACTEDEALGINLGLYMGGCRPMLLIQNSGFYAALNNIRGLTLDAAVPACMLIGEFARDPMMPPDKQAYRLVQLLEPTLKTWSIPYHRLDKASDLGKIESGIHQAWEECGPVALIVGAPTAEPR